MNSVVHFEIPAEDKGRAKKFYAEAFGWVINDIEIGGGEIYSAAVTTQSDEQTGMPNKPGAINGALFDRDEKLKTPVITISVDSVDEALAKIEEAGGERLVEKGVVPEMGYYAYFKDSEGNVMGLWEEMKK